MLRRVTALLGVLIVAIVACSAPVSRATADVPVAATEALTEPSSSASASSTEKPATGATSWIEPSLDPALAEGLASLAWVAGGDERQEPWRFGTYGGQAFSFERSVEEADLTAFGGQIVVMTDGPMGSDISTLDATTGAETQVAADVLPGPSDGYAVYAIPRSDGLFVYVADDGPLAEGRLLSIDVTTHDQAPLVPAGLAGGQVTNMRWSGGRDALLHAWCWASVGCRITVVGPDQVRTVETDIYPVAATTGHVLGGSAPDLGTWVVLDMATQEVAELADPDGLVRRPLRGALALIDGSFIVDSGGQLVRVNAVEASVSVLVGADAWLGWTLGREILAERWVLLERDRLEVPGGLTDAEMRHVGVLDVTTGSILPEVARRAP